MVTVGEKVITQKVRKQVKDPRRYGDTTGTTSRTNRIEPDSNYIKIQAKKASSVKSIQSSKLVVTATQIKHGYNKKNTRKLVLRREHYDQRSQS